MTKLATWVAQRGANKGRLTKFLKTVREFPLDGDVMQLKIRRKKVEECWIEFQDLQIKIEMENETTSESEETYRTEFEETYYSAISEYEKLLEKQNKMSSEEYRSGESNGPNGSIRTQNGTGSVTNQASIVKLAALNVPKFSGDYKEWATFHDMFVALIHTNEALSDIQRFFYLKSALIGDAAKTIQCLEPTVKNYPIAWNCLNERFNNKRILVQNHTKAIFDMEALEKESAWKLRRFLDTLKGHMKSLEVLGYELENWGPMLVHLIRNKLDPSTHREWETKASKTEVAKVSEIIHFLEERFQILEAIQDVPKTNEKIVKKSYGQTTQSKWRTGSENNKRTIMHAITTKIKCYACDNEHAIYRCPIFLALPIAERWQKVKEFKICEVCLSKHAENKCKFSGCRKCNQKHNTLLHGSEELVKSDEISINAHVIRNNLGQIVLSTAMIKILDVTGQTVMARALLDSGSQSNLMTTELAQRLRLPRKKVKYSIIDVEQKTSQSNFSVRTMIRGRNTMYVGEFEFLTLRKITTDLPLQTIDTSELNLPDYVQLADPSFAHPGKIDILIGAECFYNILRIGNYKPKSSKLVFQETELGWIVAGSTENKVSAVAHVAISETINNYTNLEEEISKFWRLEEMTPQTTYSEEEKLCVQHFNQTVNRGEDGRFIVELPLRKDIKINLGDSKTIALRRFLSIENRLNKDSQLRMNYNQFMEEYETLGHMIKINDPHNERHTSKLSYYMPHHAIQREDSITTKTRVVFDASCATTSGQSLNDVLLKGPTIQDDIICLLARFRVHKYVLSADVTKMYRQIWITERDRSLQKILWRKKPDDPMEVYNLKTVTYGTKAASFLATACLGKLADENIKQYPIASKAIKNDFYMDDYLGGANTITEAINLRDDIINIMSSAGFPLRKWVSNDPRLLENIPNTDNDPLRVLNLNGNTIKTLGLFWCPKYDTYQYKVNEPMNNNRNITKREILSIIAAIYDPLGLIGPIVVAAKLIMQQLWQLKIDWDESLPSTVNNEWQKYCDNIKQIKDIIIPRRIIGDGEIINLQIHGFSDASTKAYGACIYLRSSDRHGNHTSRLIAAKSRVAPLKIITLARLELCAAVLLVRLVEKIVPRLQLNTQNKYFWSDSSIVLAWLNSPSSRWKTFIAHRVGEIHNCSTAVQWQHVKSEDNPADLISRGCNPSTLQKSKLWWEGPQWLKLEEKKWSKEKLSTSELPKENLEEKISLVTSMITNNVEQFTLIKKYSSLKKLLRVTVYILRWKYMKINKKRFSIKIDAHEIQDAQERIIKYVQLTYFKSEINQLKNDTTVSSKSKLFKLRPWLDKNNIIRVGGRLNEAINLSRDVKNPIILPAQSIFTNLIFHNEHLRLMHAGPQALLSSVREQFWPVNGRNIARHIVHKCVRCFRAKPTTFKPIMGNLPKTRVEIAQRAFENCGVDFAGPILIKTGTRKNAPIAKAYVCVFVCFFSKAVHIELVSDLSTNAFLAALRRFWARRGISKIIYSDNGTNFVGADRQLKELRNLFLSTQHKLQLDKCLEEVGVRWNFIPSRSPHFGGLWEAAVKSIKGHLRRTLGNALLNFEELMTVLIRIEACLNSRPITPLSSDPSDLNALTPAHFLIGGSLTCLPEPNLTEPMVSNYSSRWQRTQQLFQQIWVRWSREYLSQLQERTKWQSSRGVAIKDGMLVLLKDDNLPPLQWSLGRVVQTLPGKDGIIRVAIIQTKHSQTRRATRNVPCRQNSMITKNNKKNEKEW